VDDICQDVPAVVGDTEYCTDCKKFFTDFKEMITDKTEQVRCLFEQFYARCASKELRALLPFQMVL